jgi:hypothetical protein
VLLWLLLLPRLRWLLLRLLLWLLLRLLLRLLGLLPRCPSLLPLLVSFVV